MEGVQDRSKAKRFLLYIYILMHATHRHCAASMQAVDGSLGFGMSLEFYKSAPCNKRECRVSYITD